MYYNRDGKKVELVKKLNTGEFLFRTTKKYYKNYGDPYNTLFVPVKLTTIKKELPEWVVL